MKILLIRLDKIGDLICTLGVDQLLPTGFQTQWAVAAGLEPLLNLASPQRQGHGFQKKFSFKNFLKFIEFLRQNKLDMAVSFQGPWWISAALWLQRVPIRVGVRSQWHSFLFLTAGLRQKRSQSLQHESDYNKDLLLFAVKQISGGRTTTPDIPLSTITESVSLDSTVTASSSPSSIFKLDSEKILALSKDRLDKILRNFLQTTEAYIVIHPGMAGSALNWPSENYVSLISELAKKYKIIVTGTTMDEPWLGPIKNALAQPLLSVAAKNILILQNELSLTELLYVLKKSLLVIAPSTGVAHLAASLDRPVIGLYSPVLVHRSLRWKPRGEQVSVLEPSVNCPATHQCLKEQCPYFECMKNMSVQSVLDQVMTIL
ncbi:MAG: glycosyltransferase family 9 protein [Pseudobdellovibrionaceae bacterium]